MPENEDNNVRAMWSEDELDNALAALRPAEDPDDAGLRPGRTELLIAAGGREPAAEKQAEPPPTRSRRRWGWCFASAAPSPRPWRACWWFRPCSSTNTLPSAAAGR